MNAAFWHERWQNQQIGFHQQEINAYLCTHWQELGILPGSRVLVPLCGKSLDMLWLAEQGHPILGVELSPKAVADFFQENNLVCQTQSDGAFTHWQAQTIELLCGDFFQLEATHVQQIEAVYDRAALIALPPDLRQQYVQHLARILHKNVHILLITLEREVHDEQGPPFSVQDEEVRELYTAAGFQVELKAQWSIKTQRQLPAIERIYHLYRRAETL